ncbi:hypothetical protein ACP70R_009601 [Stipagrostis hirtigluma subsp. patula]
MVCPAGDGRCGDRCAGVSAGWEWAGGASSSTVAEWGLVCGERYKVGLAQSAFFVGSMIGAGVFGHLSDSFLGRKGPLQVACVLSAAFGLLTALSPNYWAYAALRLLTGFSAGSVAVLSFCLATEPIGPSRRGTAGISSYYFFSAGIAACSGLAALFPASWRVLYVVTSLPSLLYDVTLKLDGEDVEKQSSASIVDVLQSPTTRTLLVLSVLLNFLCSVVYYGLSLNVVNLKTNLYVSVLLNSVADLPACLLITLLLNRFGRKPLCIGLMLLGGVACTAGSLIAGISVMMVMIRMACGVVGIFGVGATYILLFVYTAELFPTVVRNVALGFATQATQVGAIVAPLVVMLGERVPFAVFGASAIMGTLLVSYLPETMNKPMYDTMAGLEEGERSLLK